MRCQPQLTLLNHNALAMFYRNDIQSFMAAKFTEPEDYAYLRKLAQESGGEERKRHQEIIEFRDKQQDIKQQQERKRVASTKATAERLAALSIVLSKEEITGLRGPKLKDQFLLFKKAGAPT